MRPSQQQECDEHKKKSKYIRTYLLAFSMVLLLVVSGCQQHPARAILATQDVNTLAAEFDAISNAHIDAWNNHDLNQMRKLYIDDILYFERASSSPDMQGIDDVIGLNKGVIAGSPQIGGRQAGTFIGRGVGFDNWQIWGYDENLGFSKDNPINVYDMYVIRDGKIAEWRLNWGSEYVPLAGMLLVEKPLPEYATAWSSSDPKAIASLYDPQAVRTDTLFGDNQQGSSTIKEFAGNFFAWYPGARFELLKTIQYNMLGIGGVYAIHVSDQAGQPCAVRAIILMDSKMDQNTREFDIISNERVFYQPDTLLTCGWAR